jgi:hypothetical protein
MHVVLEIWQKYVDALEELEGVSSSSSSPKNGTQPGRLQLKSNIEAIARNVNFFVEVFIAYPHCKVNCTNPT